MLVRLPDITFGKCQNKKKKCTSDSKYLSNKCMNNQLCFTMKLTPIVHGDYDYQFNVFFIDSRSSKMYCGKRQRGGDTCTCNDE